MSKDKLSKAKAKMKQYTDFFGGEMDASEIDAAKSVADLNAIFTKLHHRFDDMASDAQMHLKNFKAKLKLDQ